MPALVEKEVKDEDNGGDKRGQWKRPLEFVLSTVGYAVGMGSLYRFPYLAMRNGGGAFLIPYLLFAFICGIPLFFMETALGQYYQRSPLHIFDICPLFKGIGMAMCLLSLVVTIYYMVVIAWALYYLVMTFSATLPWTTCGNAWNTNSCISLIFDQVNNTTSNITGSTSANVSRVEGILAAEEFWENNVLRLSSGIEDIGSINWHLALALLVGWLCVFICIFKGIASSRIAVYITATAPFLLLVVLMCWSVTLPGAIDGILVYIVPRWEKMANYQIWIEAFIQVFYSLGPAWGGLITLASYNPFHHNCFRDAVIVTFADVFTAILCGFVIFSGLGYMAQQRGVPVLEVVNSGPGLSFVTYPQVVATMPIPQLWAALFFVLVFFLGIDSTFGMIKTVTSGLFDLYPATLGRKKTMVSLALCCFCYVIGLLFVTRAGMYLFQMIDWYASVFTVQFIALLESVLLCYIYGADRFLRNIKEMMPNCHNWFICLMKYCWKFVIPVCMLIALTFAFVTFRSPKYGSYEYPEWTNVFGWILAMSSSLPIPIVLVYQLYREEGSFIQRWRRGTVSRIWRDNGAVMQVANDFSSPGVENVKYVHQPGDIEEMEVFLTKH